MIHPGVQPKIERIGTTLHEVRRCLVIGMLGGEVADLILDEFLEAVLGKRYHFGRDATGHLIKVSKP
jgi:hypothetical protein